MLKLEVRNDAWTRAQLPEPPPAEPAEGYHVGDLIRLGFVGRDTTERAWVRLTVVGDEGLEGRLVGDLHYIPKMLAGARVAFGRRHVLAHRRDENL